METGLLNKVAMISGASKGLGKAIAFALAREGVKLSICARNEGNLKEIAKELHSNTGVEVEYTVVDMSEKGDINKFVNNTLNRFGKIDILINSAGSAPIGNFLEIDDETWFKSWNLKFMGYKRLAQTVFPYMKKNQEGRIINIIGSWGRHVMKNYMVGGHINAALLNFTKLLADEAANYNILVNGINPGPIQTDRWSNMLSNMAFHANEDPEKIEKELLSKIPLNRPGKPEEVADLVTFLVSERSTYITGSIVTIDGGMTRSI